MNTLKEGIGDWTDIDFAQFHLARCLGLMGSEVDFGRAKHVFWSNNAIGKMLYEILKEPIERGILEVHPDDDLIVRWNTTFAGSWEHEWQPDNPT